MREGEKKRGRTKTNGDPKNDEEQNRTADGSLSLWDINNVPAVERGAGMDGQKITCTLIMHRLGDLFYRLVSQKFEDPAEGETALVAKFKKLYDDLTAGSVISRMKLDDLTEDFEMGRKPLRA